ncbi:MAG TPA: DUF559 domain-containing protein [Anaerolineales bacterium]|nr:DUF559 domain-containing protein [Anaerolineales bacterium]
MHKRTTPKIFTRAKELRRKMTPIEIKLWKHLRAHRLDGVHFRPQHAIGNYTSTGSVQALQIFVRRVRNSSSNSMAASIWSRKNMTLSAQRFSNRKVIKFFASAIMMY